MDNVKIGEFIATLRKEKQLTQKDLAEKLFVSDRAVSKWERGLSLPDISIISKLSEILEISLSELLAGEKIASITKSESDNIIKSSVASYKTTYSKKLFKRLITIFPIATIALILLIFTIGELSKGYVPFTNYQAEWDVPSFSQRKNRQLVQKFFKALKKNDYDAISKMIYPNQKSKDTYIKDLKALEKQGVKFTTYQYWSNDFGELGYSANYLIQLEYKDMLGQLIICISTMNKNRISIDEVNYQETLTITQDKIWKQITDAIVT